MTNEEINAAIAVTQGWDMDPEEARDWDSRGKWCASPSGEMTFKHNIPNYCGDLNLIRDARQKLTPFEKELLACYLEKMLQPSLINGERPTGNVSPYLTWSGVFTILDATAKDQATALLKVLSGRRGTLVAITPTSATPSAN